MPPGTPGDTAVPERGQHHAAGCLRAWLPRCRLRGDLGSFGPVVEAMYQARHAAIDRMTAECAALGGHGLWASGCPRGSFALGKLELRAILRRAGELPAKTNTKGDPQPPASQHAADTCRIATCRGPLNSDPVLRSAVEHR